MWMIILNVLQGVGLVALSGFSLHYFWLLGVWIRGHRRMPAAPCQSDRWPAVTVQLPVFNERYVVGRLLDAVSRLDYPKDRLEIQVLDDSTDDTTELVAARVAALRAGGWLASHVRRPHRGGFKAGALAEGLSVARGEFIALFDADFVPPPEFLRRTIPYFADPGVGMVQARWGYLNRQESFLTRAQAIMIDGHFLIEQVARSAAGVFFNFNGSAGVWRARAITEAGGWQSDTLSEDLDLSYRAQLKGWRFIYVPDVVVPGELPADMSSLKAQHRRWAQGSVQTALKLLPEILRSAQPLRVKVEACFHFGSWLTYPLCIVAALLILPQLMTSRMLTDVQPLHVWGGLISTCVVATTVVFHAAAQQRAGTLQWRFPMDVLVLMGVSVGLALNNSRAIWDALRGSPGVFHRTPKYSGRYGDARRHGYHTAVSARWWMTEVALGVYLCVALGYAASQAFYSVLPFLLPLSAGFLYSGLSAFSPAGDGTPINEA